MLNQCIKVKKIADCRFVMKSTVNSPEVNIIKTKTCNYIFIFEDAVLVAHAFADF